GSPRRSCCWNGPEALAALASATLTTTPGGVAARTAATASTPTAVTTSSRTDRCSCVRASRSRRSASRAARRWERLAGAGWSAAVAVSAYRRCTTVRECPPSHSRTPTTASLTASNWPYLVPTRAASEPTCRHVIRTPVTTSVI